MTSLEFTINHTDQSARTGCLQINGRQVRTPAFVQTGGELTKLSADQLKQAGVHIIKVAGLQQWLTNEAVLPEIGDFHQLFHWPGLLFVDLQTDLAYQLAKPRGRKKDGVRFHDPATGQLKFWQPTTALQVQQTLGADLLQSFDQATDYYAPVDDLQAGMARTNDWLAVNQAVAGQTFGSVTGGGLKELRTTSVHAVDEHQLAGYRLSGLPADLRDQEFERIINEVIPLLSPSKPRYLPMASSLPQLLRAVLAGVDLIDSDLAAKKAAEGVALIENGTTSLSLDRQHFRTDHRVIDSACDCPACQGGYSRAMLHLLVVNHDLYGEQLLLQHNLTTLNRLMVQLRQAIDQQQIKRFVEELLANC